MQQLALSTWKRPPSWAATDISSRAATIAQLTPCPPMPPRPRPCCSLRLPVLIAWDRSTAELPIRIVPPFTLTLQHIHRHGCKRASLRCFRYWGSYTITHVCRTHIYRMCSASPELTPSCFFLAGMFSLRDFSPPRAPACAQHVSWRGGARNYVPQKHPPLLPISGMSVDG